jgi:hypothetical protein
MLIDIVKATHHNPVLLEFWPLFPNIRQGSLEIDVITAEECDDAPRAPSKSFVECVRLPSVLLAHPVCEPSFISLNNLDGSVLARTIDDDVLKIWITL